MKYKSVYAVHQLCHLLGDCETDLFFSEADARAFYLDLMMQVEESLDELEILTDEADELYYCNESSGEYIRIVFEEIKVK
jgi:hypothetical protein|tara:strand:+ start:397 stop:636 length:240 start_codon:yes stop_codon:yes gene_type:complete